LDPDLNKQVIKRLKEWKPLYGQIGASQSHLDNNCVEVGDLFIFFGWFKNTTEENDCLKFDRRDKEGKHIIFGYFQIGEIIKTSTLNGDIPEWMKYHSHYENITRRNHPKNTIYVAKDTLSWNDDIPGAGTFKLDAECDHIGIVVKCNPGFIQVAEGNYNNVSAIVDRPLDEHIRGFIRLEQTN